MSVTPHSDIKLHIGGTERREGWAILNIVPGPHVDYIGHCKDLSFLANESCAEVYASHVLEHLGYNGEIQLALKEACRVLKPGGRIRVSVPDLEILCRLFIHPKGTFKDRYRIMRMMFGGRGDAYDVHQSGLTFELLHYFLEEAGFTRISRVENFGEFNDTSQQKYGAQPISLNMEAYK
ncbi:MAG: methyltransferase domain-containing protein [Rhodospirillaceae bacterium]|nr:methyltransferase domain-containing protein [Rhodospirillaceae bacterium]